MHALSNEPLQGEAAHTSNIVEIFLMSKGRNLSGQQANTRAVQASVQQQPHAEVFTFGDPVPVLDRRARSAPPFIKAHRLPLSATS